MMKRHRVHLLVLFVLCVQVVAPLFTAVPAAAPLSAVAAEPLDYPQPLAPAAQAIRQQAAAQAAETMPDAEAPPLRAPGTITATTETAQEPAARVFLPLVRTEGTASSELALAPDVWMAATAGWTIHELPALVVVRTPPEWQTTIVSQSITTTTLLATTAAQTVAVSIEPLATAVLQAVPDHPALAAYERREQSVRAAEVKGIPAWDVHTPAGEPTLCRDLFVQIGNAWVRFQLYRAATSTCQHDSFDLITSSLQRLPETGSLPAVRASADPPAASLAAAINYNRQAAYDYAARWWNEENNVSGSYYPGADGANFIAHAIEVGGFPIRARAGQPNDDPAVIQITAQRNYINGTNNATRTNAGNMREGDVVYAVGTNGCQGGVVVRVDGGSPYIASHTINRWNERYDVMTCSGGQSYEFLHILSFNDYRIDSGLNLSPAVQSTDDTIQASFRVRHYGQQTRDVSLRVRTDNYGTLRARGCRLNPGSTCSYSEAISSGDREGTFQAFAEIDYGEGWRDLPTEGSTSQRASGEFRFPPDVVVIDGPNLSPTDLPAGGGSIQATFAVENVGGLPATERYRAQAERNGTAVGDFPASGNITLNPDATYTYQNNRSLSDIGVYQVFAEQFDGSTWRRMVGQDTAFFRIRDVPPPPAQTVKGHPPTCGYAGDPVNTATGNYFRQDTDLSEPTPGLPLNATRWYNAIGAASVSGPFGYGTAWQYDMTITYRNDKSALIRMADGSTAYFLGDITTGDPFSLAGTYIGQDEDIGTLVRADDGTAVLTTPDQTSYHFNADGRIERISHPHPAEITVAYSGTLPIELVHSAGVTYTIAYSGALISDITASSGRSVQYTYANGNLVEVMRPDGSTYRYDYDANHRLTVGYTPLGEAFVRNIYDADGRVVRQFDQAGKESVFSYGADITDTRVFTDALGQVITHTYDADYRLMVEEDALGNQTTYTRDAQGNILSQTDRTGATWAWTYDDQGNMLTATDPLGNVTTYEYDSRNNRTAMIDPTGIRTDYTYDSQNRLTTETDALGHSRTYEYDAAGNLVLERDKVGNETRYAYNDQGLRTAIIDALGNQTRIAYDAFGNTQVYTDANGHVARSVYDAENRLVESIDPAGAVFTYTYDLMGNLLSESDGLGNLKFYTYDAYDRVVAETDFNGATTTYEYDALGRTVAITDALGQTTRTTYDAVGNLVAVTARDGTVTRHEYDAEQRRIRTIDPLGRETRFVYDEAGRLRETHRPCDPAVCAGGIAITAVTYDRAGRVLTETDPRGNTTTTTYDALGRTETVTFADSGTLTYSYDEAGRQTQMVDQIGASTSYTYDALGRVITTTDALGFTRGQDYDPVGNLLVEHNTRGFTTTYTYDANDRLMAETNALSQTTRHTYDEQGRRLSSTDPLNRTTTYTYDANGNQTSMTDPRGNTTTTEYDVLNRPIATIDALGQTSTMEYDVMGRLVAETDALGHTTRHDYDDAGQRTRTTSPEGYTTTFTYDVAGNRVVETDTLGHTTRATYDAAGNLVQQTDALGQVRTMTYDEMNRLVSETDEQGATRTRSYDQAGRLVAEEDARGATTRYEYDLLGRTVEDRTPLGYTRVYTYNAEGSLLAEQDADGFVTTYAYDALERQVMQTDPLGQQRISEYDAAGQLVAETDYNGNRTSYTYDAAGNRIAITNALGDVATTGYDVLNRVISTTDELGRSRFTGYDALGRTISETTSLGFTTVYTYNAEGWQIARSDALGQTTTTTYDDLGRRTAETDPLGRTTTSEYDALGRMTAETDPLNRTTTYEYDALGRLVVLTAPDGTSQQYTYDPLGNVLTETDANGHITRFEYDAEGRQVRKTDPLGHDWQYQYDGRGNQTGMQLPSGTRITMAYDALGRLRQTDYNGTREVAFGYDANGNRTAMTDQLGQTTYTYDALNRLVGSSDWANRTASYGYDAVGQRTSITYPDGTIASYSYDDDGRLERVSVPNSGATSYSYDALGRETQVQQANGVTVASTYDAMGNLLSREQRAADGRLITRHSYTYNVVNQRTRLVETLPERTITTDYTYDDLDRLVASVASDGRTTTYTLDNVGNRLAMAGTRTRDGITETYRIAYDYNALNQLLRTDDSATGETFYRYTDDGRRTGSFAETRRASYTYTAEGRLQEARVEERPTTSDNWALADGMYERYAYDGEGRRVRRDIVSGRLDSVMQREENRYDDAQSWNVLQTYDLTTEEQSTRYLYARALQKLAVSEEGDTRYMQQDGLGSVLGATDASGDFASPAVMRYSDYGELLGDADALPTSDAYTGHEYEDYTGLHYARNRYYDQATGTFLTLDPFPANRDDMLDLHRYLYVQANPINNVDPLGLFKVTSNTTGLIESGDTLSGIAWSLGTSVSELQRLNPFITNPDYIQAGWTITIPPQNSAKDNADQQQQNAVSQGTNDPHCANKNCNIQYTVQSGDTLSGIGARYDINWNWIYNANRSQISNPNLIRVGQQLWIPCSDPGSGGNPGGGNPGSGGNPGGGNPGNGNPGGDDDGGGGGNSGGGEDTGCGSNTCYRDVTRNFVDWLNTARNHYSTRLAKELNEQAHIELERYNSKKLYDPRRYWDYVNYLTKKGEAYGVFSERVAENRPWDIKRKAPYAGAEKVRICNKTIGADSPGNMLYAYAGRACTFSEYELRNSSAIVQLLVATKNYGVKLDGEGFIRSLSGEFRDQQVLTVGFNTWNTFGRNYISQSRFCDFFQWQHID